MITGFSGHLISEQFLEQQLMGVGAGLESAAALAAFRKCRARHHLLGPASSLRSLLESGVTPIAALLGFRAVTDVHVREDAALATLGADGVAITLVVTRWGERLDPWWRVGIAEAAGRGASWCLLFNGTRLRLVNASRVFSRRFAEVDLDCAADDERTFAAMRLLMTTDAHAKRSPNHERALVDALIDSSERHASAVCHSLRNGVLEGSEQVLQALVARPHKQAVTEVF